MVRTYSRRAMFATALAPVLAPAFGGIKCDNVTLAPPASRRRIVVTCGEFVQVTLYVETVEEAVREAREYRQPGDDLALWEDGRLVGTVTDAPAPTAAYTSSGIPRAVTYVASGPRPASTVGRCVLPADSGPGFFVLEDHRPAAQLEAVRRFIDQNDRSPETMRLVTAAICAPA